MSTALNFRRGDEISFLLTTDREIKKIHGKFLKKKSATDVITFVDAMGRKKVVDIVISLDQATRQATPRNLELATETVLLMLHGLLHARGFDDLTESDAIKMRQQEFQIMSRIL